jgi:2-iminobutanoate/2-iminopropanoate deaminase
MVMRITQTNPPGLSRPGGHYSHVVVHGGVAYVSGQLPIAPDGPLPPDASFERQARQVLANVRAAVEGAGSDLSRVLKCTVYVTDIADWPEFNRLYAEEFGEHRPARAVVPVSPLHFGYRLEMDAIAAVD